MDTGVMFLDCPACLNGQAGQRCGLPAAVQRWYTMGSADGPLESARIECPRGHWFNGPIASLTWDPADQQRPAVESVAHRMTLAPSDRPRS
jgi:hypothetical protein